MIAYIFANYTYDINYNDNKKFTLTGKIVDISFSAKNESITVYSNKHNSKIIVYIENGKYNFKIGNIILVKGVFKSYKKPTSKGEFNSLKFHKSRNEIGYIYEESIEILDKNYNVILNGIIELKNRMEYSIDLIYDKHKRGLIKSILFGDKSELKPETKVLYQDNGISHLLAISGLHLSFIGLAICEAIRKFSKSYLISTVITLSIMGAYIVICGLGPSICRAYIMLVLFMLSKVFGRSVDIATSLSISAIISISLNVYVTLNQGFIFSYLSVLLLGVILPYFEINIFFKLIIFQLGILPIVVLYYFSYPTYSIIINLIVIPLFAVLLVAALLSIGLFDIYYIGSIVFSKIANMIINLYEIICKLFLRLPFNSLKIGKPNYVSILLYYLIYSICLIILYTKRNLDKNEKDEIYKEKNWFYFTSYFTIKCRNFIYKQFK